MQVSAEAAVRLTVSSELSVYVAELGSVQCNYGIDLLTDDMRKSLLAAAYAIKFCKALPDVEYPWQIRESIIRAAQYFRVSHDETEMIVKAIMRTAP